MSFTIVSFYTLNTPYANEINHLLDSLDKLGLRYHIQGVPSRGSWEKNCQFKADFILEALENIDTDIVWIDADAVLMAYPALFENMECDIAFHLLQHRSELLSGTLFIKNNEKMRSVVKKWIMLNASNSRWDQKNLQQIVESEEGLNTEVLPASYCKIFDNKHQQNAEQVIVHYQASRKYRRAIGRVGK